MNLLFSSVGKKLQVAISGILLVVFLLFHLFNNLVLFAGEESFNNMVGFLESIKPIIRIMEFGLLSILLMHTVNAIRLTFANKALRHTPYNQTSSDSSSLNSRTMAISGTIILIFLFIHLGFVWLTYQTTESHNYYQILLQNKIGFLGHFPTSIFYIISIMAIGMHLRHGFQSALKTFGVLSKSKWGLLYNIGALFWGVIPILFILIIISIQIGWIS